MFQLTTNGTLTTLVSFSGVANGASPQASLTLGPDGNFYGTTASGGSDSYGTVFQVTTNGTLTTLVSFSGGANGAGPAGSLTLGPDGSFYGTTFSDGIYYDNYGTVFKVTTKGTLTTLAAFGGTNGANPHAGLTLGPDGNFYGTTVGPVTAKTYGTIFRLELPPEFIVAPTDQTVVIGDSATFGCHLFGTAPYAYQWLSNGVAIAGATNASLTFSPAIPSNVGNYQLVVTNSWGSITSQVATLSVLVQPNVYAISNIGVGNYTIYLANQPNSTNRLWAATNLASNQWQVISTNVMDGNGLGQFVDTNTTGMPQKFYRFSYP